MISTNSGRIVLLDPVERRYRKNIHVSRYLRGRNCVCSALGSASIHEHLSIRISQYSTTPAIANHTSYVPSSPCKPTKHGPSTWSGMSPVTFWMYHSCETGS